MKCSNHPDKEAVAVCERCNLSYCGNCSLSKNGKCPKCGNTLRSPQVMLSYEINQDELYKGKGQPGRFELVNLLYLEPSRMMKRLKAYSSLFSGVINVTIIYFLVMLIVVGVVVSILPTPPAATTGANPAFTLTNVGGIIRFLIYLVLYFGVFVIVWLFSSLLLYLPAKLLGGKGEYVQQAFLLSCIMLAISPVVLLSLMLSFIPSWGELIAIIAAFVVLLYYLYLIFLSIREIHEFKSTNALVSLFISILVPTLLSAATIALFYIVSFIGNLVHPSV